MLKPELELLSLPLYTALVEYVAGQVKVRGLSVTFLFSSPPVRGVLYLGKHYPSVAELIQRFYGGCVKYNNVQLVYRKTLEPVQCFPSSGSYRSSFQALLDYRDSLPYETLCQLNLQLSLLSVASDIEKEIFLVKQQIFELQARTRVLEACLQSCCDRQHIVSKEEIRNSKILLDKLKAKNWTVWTGTETQYTLLIDQLKICKGQVDMLDYCLEHVYHLESIQKQLTVRDGRLYDTRQQQYLVIFYTDTFHCLDYCYE